MTPSPSSPVITLTTDFGLSDHYVGTMKGVLLSRCPGAILVDISHEIPPFSIYSGAYAIDQAFRYFPRGTVHLVVVDPGVGTARKAIAARVSGYTFVAPDNGVLSLVLSRYPDCCVREITNRAFWLEPVSDTFHGRDIFAPVAGSLAASPALFDEVGPACAAFTTLPDLEPQFISDGMWRGRVLTVDRFGNVITNFPVDRFQPGAFHIETGREVVRIFCKTFGEAPAGVCFAYFGSSGFVELAINQQSAAHRLQIQPGDPVSLRIVSR